MEPSNHLKMYFSIDEFPANHGLLQGKCLITMLSQSPVGGSSEYTFGVSLGEAWFDDVLGATSGLLKEILTQPMVKL